MKLHIYPLALLLCLLILPATLAAAPEAEYKKLSRTYTLHADGSQEYRYAMELTLYTHTAMNRTYGETFVVYNPQYQELKINEARVVQKDGTVITTPDNAFVEVLPSQAANAPEYNHLKEMVIVHTGLELGATIYLDYSIVTKPGYLPNLDICEAVWQTSPVTDYTLTIQTPENKPLAYNLYNLKDKPSVSTTNGVRTVTWKIKNMPASSRAPQVTAMGGDVPLLTATTYPAAADALTALKGQLSSPDAAMRERASTITTDSITQQEKLTKILDYVVDLVGNSGLSLQETGYKLRPAQQVIESAYGTRAEKANLLACLLNCTGIQADIVASYPVLADASCGLSAVSELLVCTNVDGKAYLLSPTQKSMAAAGWHTAYASLLSVSDPGKAVAIKIPATGLEYKVATTLCKEKASNQIAATAGDAFLPYSGSAAARFAAGDKEATEEKADGYTTFTYSQNQSLKATGDYILWTLPDSPESLSHAAYSRYNSKRTENLLLNYAASEQYKYEITLPEGMTLHTPLAVKSIDNKAGRLMISVRRIGETIEVIRTLEIDHTLIKPSEYADFRTLMTEWADVNGRTLLFKVE